MSMIHDADDYSYGNVCIYGKIYRVLMKTIVVMVDVAICANCMTEDISER